METLITEKVKYGEIISTGRNRREILKNALLHAEIEAIHKACENLDRFGDCERFRGKPAEEVGGVSRHIFRKRYSFKCRHTVERLRAGLEYAIFPVNDVFDRRTVHKVVAVYVTARHRYFFQVFGDIIRGGVRIAAGFILLRRGYATRERAAENRAEGVTRSFAIRAVRFADEGQDDLFQVFTAVKRSRRNLRYAVGDNDNFRRTVFKRAIVNSRYGSAADRRGDAHFLSLHIYARNSVSGAIGTVFIIGCRAVFCQRTNGTFTAYEVVPARKRFFRLRMRTVLTAVIFHAVFHTGYDGRRDEFPNMPDRLDDLRFFFVAVFAVEVLRTVLFAKRLNLRSHRPSMPRSRHDIFFGFLTFAVFAAVVDKAVRFAKRRFFVRHKPAVAERGNRLFVDVVTYRANARFQARNRTGGGYRRYAFMSSGAFVPVWYHSQSVLIQFYIVILYEKKSIE